jgi:hypothetical protein
MLATAVGFHDAVDHLRVTSKVRLGRSIAQGLLRLTAERLGSAAAWLRSPTAG